MAHPFLTNPGARMTGAQGVAAVIAAQSRPRVFGMPGGHTVQIFDALYSLRDEVEINLVRQESVATVMAEAQGRLTGEPAFVIGQGAWVLGNAGIGIMEAHLGASPMVVLVDATDGGAFSHHGPYQAGFGGYGGYDLTAALSAITKRTFLATEPIQALQMTQLALAHATTGEPGPVAVVFHSRALTGWIEAGAQPTAYRTDPLSNRYVPAATADRLADLVSLLRGSSRPVVIAGNGVRLAAAETALRELAHLADIPVATTPAGKGTFPEDDALALGVIGSFGHDTANRVVGNADLVLAIGTKLGATDTANGNPQLIDPARQTIVQLDVEPLNVSWTVPVDLGVVGDARDALPRIAVELLGASFGGAARVAAARESTHYFSRATTSKPGRLSARDVIGELSVWAPADAIVTCDAGENRLFVLRDFQSKQGGSVLQPNGGGGMGYAIPAGMAAAVNAPGRQVVAVCGDGGFGMTLTALLSAVELELTMAVLVLDNHVLGWVHSGQRGRTIASTFGDVDYGAIAASIGAHVHRVQSLEEVRAALRAAGSTTGVSVIVASTSTDDRYQDILSSLNRDDVYAVAGD